MKKFYGFTVLALVIAFGLGSLTGYYARGFQQPAEKIQAESPAVSYKFYLAEKDGMVTVYRADNDEIYEYTDIQMDHLPEDVQKEISMYKYMKDEGELYDFLESYTS